MNDNYLKINYFGKRNKKINELIYEHINSAEEEKRNLCLRELVSMADKEIDIEKYDAYKESLKNNNIKTMYISDENYPEKLRKIYDPPLVLFYKGSIEILNKKPCVAIVGSRKCSNYGRQIAFSFAKKLSEAGIVVVSGMAYGIDTNAHIGAMAGFEPTVAVMGTGIDQCYPSNNKTVHDEISGKGLLLTEFKPGTGPMQYNFPRRNRIISGLSDAVIVVEAGLKSGALITADFALEQGKDVYAVPSGILGSCGKGSNKLIKQGAECLTDVNEVIDCFSARTPATPLEKLAETGMTDAERSLLEIIEMNSPVHLDKLISEAGWSINDTKAALMLLIVKDRIYMEPGNKYCIKA